MLIPKSRVVKLQEEPNYHILSVEYKKHWKYFEATKPKTYL